MSGLLIFRKILYLTFENRILIMPIWFSWNWSWMVFGMEFSLMSKLLRMFDKSFLSLYVSVNVNSSPSFACPPQALLKYEYLRLLTHLLISSSECRSNNQLSESLCMSIYIVTGFLMFSRHFPRSRPNCWQRQYLRSGGNLKLRPVPNTKRNKDNKTLIHTSTPPGANILLVAVRYSILISRVHSTLSFESSGMSKVK
jgi:hypothetical protein